MKLLLQYLIASILPALTVILTGLFQMPKDCSQCILLLLVGCGMMFAGLLVLNLFYFLMLLPFSNKPFQIVLGILASYIPSTLLTIYLFKTYYRPYNLYNTDFRLSIPSAVVAFLVSTWTFYRYMKGNFRFTNNKTIPTNNTP